VVDDLEAAEPPAWRVLLACARPYRLVLVGGGLLSLATGAVGLALPLIAKRLVDDLAQDAYPLAAFVSAGQQGMAWKRDGAV
jgi:hypothetical protein